MPGKVFISCGQRPPKETKIAKEIEKILKSFGLQSYVAVKVQGLNDIMKIADELKSSDYYLFIDFYRQDDKHFPYSLFTHQELALAYQNEFKEIIAFQEEGAPLEGFLRYIQANPETFKDEKDLYNKLRKVVKERKWHNKYSRNLFVTDINCQGPHIYSDQTGQHLQYIWHAKVNNCRPDIASVNTVCILESIEDSKGKTKISEDRGHLKWATLYQGYQQIIFPNDCADIDIFAVYADQPGIFLHSSRDISSRTPIINDVGTYKLHYKLFSVGFPQSSFIVHINYKPSSPKRSKWKVTTKAKLIN